MLYSITRQLRSMRLQHPSFSADTANARAPLKTGDAGAGRKPKTAPQIDLAPRAKPEKPLATVALDARKRLNEGYKALGHAVTDKSPANEWKAVGMDQLDRRTLYVIASNQGGLFHPAEIAAAKDRMNGQLGKVLKDAEASGVGQMRASKIYVDFLDSVSPEEKTSVQWAQQRAKAQVAYIDFAKQAGQKPANVDTGNIVVNLFARAYGEATGSNQKPEDMPAWRRAMELWHLQNEDAPRLRWTL